MKKPSLRFRPSIWVKWLVPFLFVLILLGLVASLVIVILSLLGATPNDLACLATYPLKGV